MTHHDMMALKIQFCPYVLMFAILLMYHLNFLTFQLTATIHDIGGTFVVYAVGIASHARARCLEAHPPPPLVQVPDVRHYLSNQGLVYLSVRTGATLGGSTVGTNLGPWFEAHNHLLSQAFPVDFSVRLALFSPHNKRSSERIVPMVCDSSRWKHVPWVTNVDGFMTDVQFSWWLRFLNGIKPHPWLRDQREDDSSQAGGGGVGD